MDVKKRLTLHKKMFVSFKLKLHNGPIKRQKSHSNTTTLNLNKIPITRILVDKWRYKQTLFSTNVHCGSDVNARHISRSMTNLMRRITNETLPYRSLYGRKLAQLIKNSNPINLRVCFFGSRKVSQEISQLGIFILSSARYRSFINVLNCFFHSENESQ